MSYKIYLFDALSPIEWSQAGWKLEGSDVNLDDCEIEFIRDIMLTRLPKAGVIVDAGCGVALPQRTATAGRDDWCGSVRRTGAAISERRRGTMPMMVRARP